MKYKILIFLLLIFTIGSVSASDDLIQDNLTVQPDERDVMEVPISQEINDEDVLGQVITSDDNLNDSAQGPEVLGSGLDEKDITINTNTKTIDTTKGNTVFVKIKIPKGHDAYLIIDGAGQDFNKKLSKIAHKSTKNGFTTYTVYLKDLKDYKFITENIENNDEVHVGVKFWNDYEKEYGECDDEYLVKVNKKSKTLKLKKKLMTDVWIGPYDRKSGTNKVLKIHLAITSHKKPMGDSKSKHIPGKKVKITINGVVYIKKTNSKGLIYIYPPKYLPPKEFTKVKMEFAGDSKYRGCMVINDIQIYKNPGSSKSKIKASSKTFSANKTKKYTIKVLSKGKAFKKAKVKLVINNKKFNAKTNSKGTATFNLSKLTKTGNYKATVLYMGDKKHYMAYKNVKLTVK